MIYALTNPVKDGLVEKAHDWPGASSLHALMHGKPLVLFHSDFDRLPEAG